MCKNATASKVHVALGYNTFLSKKEQIITKFKQDVQNN